MARGEITRGKPDPRGPRTWEVSGGEFQVSTIGAPFDPAALTELGNTVAQDMDNSLAFYKCNATEEFHDLRQLYDDDGYDRQRATPADIMTTFAGMRLYRESLRLSLHGVDALGGLKATHNCALSWLTMHFRGNGRLHVEPGNICRILWKAPKSRVFVVTENAGELSIS